MSGEPLASMQLSGRTPCGRGKRIKIPTNKKTIIVKTKPDTDQDLVTLNDERLRQLIDEYDEEY